MSSDRHCPKCDVKGKVKQTIVSKADGGILRLIVCPKCGKCWTTVEGSGNRLKDNKSFIILEAHNDDG